MKKRINFVAVILLLVTCSITYGQGSTDAIKIISPMPNLEVCGATLVPVSATFGNPDMFPHTLKAQFVIRNVVTNVAVYGQSAILRNMLPGEFRTVALSPYIADPNTLGQLGSFSVCASIIALDSLDQPTPWNFADTDCSALFGIRTHSMPFQDPSDYYSKAGEIMIPDQTKWVSFGARVVDGDDETFDPPPPRYQPGELVGPDSMHSPVIRLDRSDAGGHLYAGNGVGDTLTSFPFNLKGPTRMVLSFDFMRSGRNNYPDLWDESQMLGAEHTVFNNQGEVVRAGDSLIVEFKDPAESVCNPVKWNRVAGIDGGQDLEFKSFIMKITDTAATLRISGREPDTIRLDQNYLDSNFRFRLRLKANNNADQLSKTTDDDDPWYLDNIVLFRPNVGEVEVTWGRVATAYSKMPYSALTALPVYVGLKNVSGGTDIQGVPVTIEILDHGGTSYYKQTVVLGQILSFTDTIIRMPDWNAQSAVSVDPSYPFIVHASTSTRGLDFYNNQETYSLFYPDWDTAAGSFQEFAYDDGINDIPSVTQIANAGIGFSNNTGSYAMKFTLPHIDTVFGGRIYFTDASGSPDGIRISLFNDDSAHCIPGGIVTRSDGSDVTLTDVRKGGLFNTYWPYFFPVPAVVPAGSYWLVISQLGLNNFQMGGDLSRGGGIITVADSIAPHISPVYSDPYGSQWLPDRNNGDLSCSYAIESPAGSGAWKKLMPETGWWPANANGGENQSVSWNPNVSAPYTRGGSFLPMMRALVGSAGTPFSRVPAAESGDLGFTEIYPNPMTSSSSVALQFIIPEDEPVSLIIYDAMGREIRRIINDRLEKGIHTQWWDGRYASGEAATEGMYFCILTMADRHASAKIILRK